MNPYSLAIAEAFKVKGGFIEEVEAIFTVLALHEHARGPLGVRNSEQEKPAEAGRALSY